MHLPKFPQRKVSRSAAGIWPLALVLCVLLPGVRAQAETPTVSGKIDGPLYFAMELRHEGKIVASPKLLGSPGAWIHAERRQPGAHTPDYKLSLLPTLDGDGYRIELDVAVPRAKARGHLESVPLGHGEERKLELGSRPGELEVSMLVMRVNSPEFQALMRLAQGDEAKRPETI